MSIPQTIRHMGVVTGSQAPSSSAGGSLSELLDTNVMETYGAAKCAAPTVVAATDLAPFEIPLETIAKVRFLGIRCRGGSGKLLVTSALGDDQVIPLGSGTLLLWSDPNPGEELTAIKFVGNADLSYVLAGDPA